MPRLHGGLGYFSSQQYGTVASFLGATTVIHSLPVEVSSAKVPSPTGSNRETRLGVSQISAPNTPTIPKLIPITRSIFPTIPVPPAVGVHLGVVLAHHILDSLLVSL